jgi:hypothetical protein
MATSLRSTHSMMMVFGELAGQYYYYASVVMVDAFEFGFKSF